MKETVLTSCVAVYGFRKSLSLVSGVGLREREMYRYGAPAVSSSSVCLFSVVIAITGRGGRLGGGGTHVRLYIVV